MPTRADAHMHLFKPGYVSRLPENCRREQPDEVTLYQALAEAHGVQQVLAVGYEGNAWAAGNNRYLAELAAAHPWIRPVAFVEEPAKVDVTHLESLQLDGFIGLSLYLLTEAKVGEIALVPAEVWEWMVSRHWLISVNSLGEHWAAWQLVLKRRPDLSLLVSHLGSPRAVARAPDTMTARKTMEPVTSLAQFPGVRVKLSGFYALTEPAHDYPHRASWPYVEALMTTFGSSRLLWGSDFSPSLESLSFPQTVDVLAKMPFLDHQDRQRIEGENLTALLARVSRA